MTHPKKKFPKKSIFEKKIIFSQIIQITQKKSFVGFGPIFEVLQTPKADPLYVKIWDPRGSRRLREEPLRVGANPSGS